MAFDTGWSERPAMLAASAYTAPSSPAALSISTDSTSLGLPSVMVPVLSSATALSLRASSRYVPPLMRMPRRAAEASALTTVTGVEMTSAHGQAMTSSTNAL
ncbi:hypothetical protein D3C71_430710 [compost metagenome]